MCGLLFLKNNSQTAILSCLLICWGPADWVGLPFFGQTDWQRFTSMQNGETDCERKEGTEQVPQADGFSDGPDHCKRRLFFSDLLGADSQRNTGLSDCSVDAKLRIDDGVSVRLPVGFQIL